MEVPMPDKDGYLFYVPSRKVWLELCSILDSEGFSFTECRDEIRFIEVNKDEQKR